MRAVDPDLVERESWLLAVALRQVVDGLPEGGRALIVGHSPTRSKWTQWHVQAEVHRLTRALPVGPDQRDDLVAAVTAAALSTHSLRIGAPDPNPTPDALRRGDGESVYTVHGGARYTSEPLVLAVEDRLLAANATHTRSATDQRVLSAARARLEASHGWAFDPAQVDLARSFACDDRRAWSPESGLPAPARRQRCG